MTPGSSDRVLPFDDLGALVIVLFCLGAIVLGKENATINAVLFTVIGKMYGKYQKKMPARK